MAYSVTSKIGLFTLVLFFTLGTSAHVYMTQAPTPDAQRTGPSPLRKFLDSYGTQPPTQDALEVQPASQPEDGSQSPARASDETRSSPTCQLPPDVGLRTENVSTDESTGQDHNEMWLRIQELETELNTATSRLERYLAWFNAVRS